MSYPRSTWVINLDWNFDNIPVTTLNNYKKKEPNMAKVCTINRSGFPDCCGVEVFGEMRIASTYGSSIRPSAGDEDALAKKLMGMIDPEQRGCYLYTTIASQKTEYNALKMAGFKVIGRFKNPCTDNWVLIHAWMKAPLPRRTKTVRGPRVVGRVAAPRRAAKKRRLVRSR